MTRAVFLDRDGTLIRDCGYLHKICDFELLAGVSNGIKRLNNAGFLVVLITNQSGIARGTFNESDFWTITNHLKAEIQRESGAVIDAVYFCPHLPRSSLDSPNPHVRLELIVDCNCRKPKSGMILDAAKALSIDLSNSFMVGDRKVDVMAAVNAGCKPILIGDSKELESLSPSVSKATLIVSDFASAVDLILKTQ
ncbi:HAD family hydrolase [Candidatus Micrarchaeota archaeon]|nr:HAD family hydrolase [Candidatus Micrarchaeota archaeon]